ncbi:MAG: cation transporter [Butyrivibrio sp.]|nr:cation transporter [Butyrivibrio sp.]
MVKIILEVEGMACGMCEAHVNDAIRANFAVKKVKSSHKKNRTEITAEEEPDTERLREVITQAGYTLVSARRE